MRRLSIAVIAAASTVAFNQIAAAADLPVKAPRDPPPPRPPVYSWTGLYAGVNAGFGWENTINNTATPIFCNPVQPQCPGWADTAAAAVPQKFDTHPLGFIGGGQIGYNFQFASAWVAGVEADFQGANIKGNAIVPNAVPLSFPFVTVTDTGTGSQKLDWLGTVRGRVGWLPANPLLLYATGGLAYGHVQTAVSFHNQTFLAPFCQCFTTDGSVSASDTTIRAGWTVGGGLEWMVAPNWSLKGEYLYYDLGTVSIDQRLVTTFGPGFIAHMANIPATLRGSA